MTTTPQKDPSLTKALEYMRWVANNVEKQKPTTITDAQIAKLAEDLRHAKPIVSKRVQRLKDGGSFSSDMVWVNIGRKPHPTRLTRLMAAIEATGHHAYWSDHKKLLLISPAVAGQRSRRYEACETFSKTLDSLGWHSGVLYMAG